MQYEEIFPKLRKKLRLVQIIAMLERYVEKYD